jgi:hypothetical protein
MVLLNCQCVQTRVWKIQFVLPCTSLGFVGVFNRETLYQIVLSQRFYWWLQEQDDKRETNVGCCLHLEELQVAVLGSTWKLRESDDLTNLFFRREMCIDAQVGAPGPWSLESQQMPKMHQREWRRNHSWMGGKHSACEGGRCIKIYCIPIAIALQRVFSYKCQGELTTNSRYSIHNITPEILHWSCICTWEETWIDINTRSWV